MKTLSCPRCHGPLPAEADAGIALDRCPQCRVPLRVAILPAAAASRPPGSTGSPASPGDAVCYFHAARRAVVPCDRCGRFLCALCDLPIGGGHLCPACLESGRREGHGSALESRRMRPDLIAADLLLLGLLSCGLLLPVTGLAATVVAWRYRAAPPSLVDPSVRRLRVLFVAGLACTALGVAGWAWLLTEIGPMLANWIPLP